MSMSNLIECREISKSYPIYSNPKHILYEVLFGRHLHDSFWALKDISFEIKEGQRVGIIGPNGSGKSTLLKLITGNLNPTKGDIQVHGKVSAMLSLASSLNPEETGYENIKFNLLLNGCSSQEIPSLTEEIIEFTELGPFIYSPVKTYSTGMNAKLGFGIATAIKPEILIVDEVLSVGDGYFVGKAMARMKELCKKGRGLLFVSHSTEAVLSLCDRAIWIDNGSIRMMGDVHEIVKVYEQDFMSSEDRVLRKENRKDWEEKADKISREELPELGSLRLRIIGEESLHTFAIHKILIKDGMKEHVLPLDSKKLFWESGEAVVVPFISEWGRLLSRKRNLTRVLSPITGKFRGGYIDFSIYRQMSNSPVVEVYYEALNSDGRLNVEVANTSTRRWERVVASSSKNQYMKKIVFSLPTKERVVDMVPHVYEEANVTPDDIEIEDVELIADSKKTNLLTESEPFKLRVRVNVNRKVSELDVGIKIMRSDGIYAFWQTSGMNQRLLDIDSNLLITFDFDPNLFSSGEYAVSVFCGNGWNPEENFPHSKVYCRKINALNFKILRKYSLVTFGQINTCVPVTVEKEK